MSDPNVNERVEAIIQDRGPDYQRLSNSGANMSACASGKRANGKQRRKRA